VKVLITSNFHIYEKKSIDDMIICKLCDFITSYPLIWYHYTQKIINDKKIIIYHKNYITFSLLKISNSLRQTIDKLVDNLLKMNMIKKVTKDSELISLTFYDEEVALFLSDNRIWLCYLTYYAFKQLLNDQIYLFPILKNNNIIFNLDLFFIHRNIGYGVICENYNNIDWHNFVKNNIFLILITLKNSKNNLPIVQYKYNFFVFKQDLAMILRELDLLKMFYF